MIIHSNFVAGTPSMAWTVFLFASAFLLIGIGKRRPALAAPVLVLAFISWAGCGGGGSGSSGTPGNTYSVIVTATSGNSSSNTMLTVIVQ
jgi:hypothetical protein